MKIEQIGTIDEFLIEMIRKVDNQTMHDDHDDKNKTFFIDTEFDIRK